MVDKYKESWIREIETRKIKLVSQLRDLDNLNITNKYTEADRDREKRPILLELQEIEKEMKKL